MAYKFFRLLAVVVLAFFSVNAFGQCEAQIKDFYITYMQNLEKDEAANVTLLKNHMSPELIDMLSAFAQKHGVNPIINAQDVCQYGINSISVKTIENCYIVAYKWDENSAPIHIAVNAFVSNGALMITNIIPLPVERYQD